MVFGSVRIGVENPLNLPSPYSVPIVDLERQLMLALLFFFYQLGVLRLSARDPK